MSQYRYQLYLSFVTVVTFLLLSFVHLWRDVHLDLAENILTRRLPQVLISYRFATLSVNSDVDVVLERIDSFKIFVALEKIPSAFVTHVALRIDLVGSLCLTYCFVDSAQGLELASGFWRFHLLA